MRANKNTDQTILWNIMKLRVTPLKLGRLSNTYVHEFILKVLELHQKCWIKSTKKTANIFDKVVKERLTSSNLWIWTKYFFSFDFHIVLEAIETVEWHESIKLFDKGCRLIKVLNWCTCNTLWFKCRNSITGILIHYSSQGNKTLWFFSESKWT